MTLERIISAFLGLMVMGMGLSIVALIEVIPECDEVAERVALEEHHNFLHQLLQEEHTDESD